MIDSRVFIQEWRPRNLVCEIAAAVLGAGALGAGASIYGANKAANAQSQTSQAAIANTKDMFNQIKGSAQPFIDAGSSGLDTLKNWIDPNSTSNPLSALIKLVTPGADQSATLAQTPGYQFAVGQGTRGVTNALAGRGLGGSIGAITKGVGDYVTGAAGQTWDSVVKNLLATFGSGTNALQGLVTSGTNVLGTLSGANTNATSAINSAITGQGNAQAAAANATGSAIGNFGNSLSTAALINQLTGNNGGGSVYAPGSQVPGGVGQIVAGGPNGPGVFA